MTTTSGDDHLARAFISDLLASPKVRPHDLAEVLGWSSDRTRRAMRRGEFGQPLGDEERDLHVTLAGYAAYQAAHPELPSPAPFAHAVGLRQFAAGCWPRDAKRMPLAELIEERQAR